MTRPLKAATPRPWRLLEQQTRWYNHALNKTQNRKQELFE
jgi:hypothetical protein